MRVARKNIFHYLFLFITGLLLLTGCESNCKPKRAERIKQCKTEDTAQNNMVCGQKPLTLIISKLQSATAAVKVAVYGPKNEFLNTDDVYKRYKFTPNGNTLSVKIDDLPYGEYAIATYQDISGDNKVDKNKIGIPQEPFAFSNNVKPGMSKPKYEECKFNYNACSSTHTIEMICKNKSEKNN